MGRARPSFERTGVAFTSTQRSLHLNAAHACMRLFRLRRSAFECVCKRASEDEDVLRACPPNYTRSCMASNRKSPCLWRVAVCFPAGAAELALSRQLYSQLQTFRASDIVFTHLNLTICVLRSAVAGSCCVPGAPPAQTFKLRLSLTTALYCRDCVLRSAGATWWPDLRRAALPVAEVVVRPSSSGTRLSM